MDNRELSASAALSAGAPGRPGNIGQVSRRLRPMAEQLLAENGDNVLDVLLQLLEVHFYSLLLMMDCTIDVAVLILGRVQVRLSYE